jgi:hypothetical protein
MISRREFVAAAVSVFAVSVPRARAEDQGASPETPAIIRPVLKGTPARMSELALDGPFLYDSSPEIFASDTARYFLFVPKGVTSTRLVIFSHGALADPTAYGNLLFHWASHGFLVAAPVHNDAVLEGGPTLRQNKAGEVSKWPVSTLLEDPENWKNRVDRCVECFDVADRLALSAGFRIERDRSIMVGHGYGAYITQLLMGAAVTTKGNVKLRFRDDRFFAGICLSPQGPGIMGLDEKSWSDTSSPMLHVLAENDDDFTGQSWQTRAKAFSLSAPNYKHMGLVKNAAATLFTQGVEPPLADGITQFQIVKAMTTCFLKAYGNYEKDAYANLTDNFFQRNSKGQLLEYRR